MLTNADALANATVMVLSLDPPPAEAEIDAVLDRMAIALGTTPEVKGEARRLLHARFEIRMDLGKTLVGDQHEPWLDKRRGSIMPFYWDRYKQLLLRGGWSPLVLATLDRATDELLDLLGNPVESGDWKRRGLVMGDVQSGKTASYAALMCKAADAGYRMIILLTGTLENVRRQTQERLDAAFVGFDSRDYLGKGVLQQKRYIGVGKIDSRRDGVVFTSSEHDFRKNAASALNISLRTVNEPVLVVSKKNKGVLERLTAWLRLHNAGRDGKIDVPLLLIDDEADNASVNTRGMNNPTSINAAIRALLRTFHRSTYVGFTATPFANIFVDPDVSSDLLGDDLFPADFIHVLEPPSNYVSMQALFPPLDPSDDTTEAPEPPIVTVEDNEDWLSPGHKSTAQPKGLPESLKDTLRTFLLTCAVRDLREEQGFPGGGGGIHRSMLVNVTHFTDVQNLIANELHLELEQVRMAVRLHGALGPSRAATQSKDIAELEETFRKHLADCGQPWAAVLDRLHTSISPVKVQVVNRTTGAKSLDYRSMEEQPGLRIIAVGGNALSRGLTLEGLSTSYFLRNSRAYDTLLQMGRWFGYREGYGDLCRLWMTEEAEGWYRHIVEATGELKRDFMKMQLRRAKPIEFGLRVKRHTGTLLITARNKMSSGMDVTVATHEISLMGRLVESSRLYSDRQRNEHNFQRVESLFQRLGEMQGEPQESPFGGALRWTNVPAGLVADFLESFAVHPLNHDFQGDGIAEFLRKAEAEGDEVLGQWTVALLTSGKRDEVELASLGGRKVATSERRVKPSQTGSLLVSGKSARVGGRSDVRHGLEPSLMPSHKPSEDEMREAMTRPLLITYLLHGVQKVGQAPNQSYLNGIVLPAVGLHFPGTAEESTATRTVSYRLNKVAQRQFFEDDLEGDDDPQSEDDDAED